MNGGNGKWQLAFWIVTGFFVIVTSTMTSHVITNDRIRATEDQKIMVEIVTLRSDTTSQNTAILCEIASIKTLLER